MMVLILQGQGYILIYFMGGKHTLQVCGNWRTLSDIGFLLPPCVSQELNTGRLAAGPFTQWSLFIAPRFALSFSVLQRYTFEPLLISFLKASFIQWVSLSAVFTDNWLCRLWHYQQRRLMDVLRTKVAEKRRMKETEETTKLVVRYQGGEGRRGCTL